MPPELDSETLKLTDVVASAPTKDATVLEAQASATLAGNFSERAPILPNAPAHDVTPPTPTLMA